MLSQRVAATPRKPSPTNKTIYQGVKMNAVELRDGYKFYGKENDPKIVLNRLNMNVAHGSMWVDWLASCFTWNVEVWNFLFYLGWRLWRLCKCCKTCLIDICTIEISSSYVKLILSSRNIFCASESQLKTFFFHIIFIQQKIQGCIMSIILKWIEKYAKYIK